MWDSPALFAVVRDLWKASRERSVKARHQNTLYTSISMFIVFFFLFLKIRVFLLLRSIFLREFELFLLSYGFMFIIFNTKSTIMLFMVVLQQVPSNQKTMEYSSIESLTIQPVNLQGQESHAVLHLFSWVPYLILQKREYLNGGGNNLDFMVWHFSVRQWLKRWRFFY